MRERERERESRERDRESAVKKEGEWVSYIVSGCTHYLTTSPELAFATCRTEGCSKTSHTVRVRVQEVRVGDVRGVRCEGCEV